MTTRPTDWPALMPSAADPDTLAANGPRTPRDHAAVLLDAAGDDLMAAAAVTGSTALPERVRRLAREIAGAVGSVRAQVHTAAAAIDRAATDDMIPDAARQRLDREAREVAAAGLRDADGRANAALATLEAGLTATAQPAFPAGADRAEAREEFKMLVDRAADPAETVRQLVTGTDERLAAIAASSYGASTLRSLGVDEAVIGSVATFAAQAALASGDPTRAAAARALAQLPTLRKAHQKAMHAAHFAIGGQ